MIYTLRTKKVSTSIAAVVAATTFSSIVLAQPPAPGGRPGQQPGGGRRAGGFGGGGGQFGQRQMTVLSVPMEALQSGLKLTADQKTKIAKIQEENRPRGFGGFGGGGGRGPGGGGAPGGPPGGAPGGGGGGGRRGGGGGGGGFGGGGGQRPDFQAMQARSDAAAKSIEALLTPAQKKALPTLIKDVGAMRTVGIPAQLYGDLKLTADQKSKIGTLAKQTQDSMQKMFQSAGGGGRGPGGPPGGAPGAGPGGGGGFDFQAIQKMREDTNKKAMAILTSAQKAQVDKYLKANPPRGFGGGGGGGRRGGANAQANRQRPGG